MAAALVALPVALLVALLAAVTEVEVMAVV